MALLTLEPLSPAADSPFETSAAFSTCFAVGVQGVGFRVQGSGFEVWGLGFGVWGLGFGVWGLEFRGWGSGLEVRGLRLGA